jgi:membrane-associated phospholipid phosphatase
VQVPSADTALVAGIGAGAALVARPSDNTLSRWAADLGESSYTDIGRVLGDGWIQGSAALTTYGVGLAIRDRATIHVGSDLIRAQALNAVITRVFKLTAQRKRPGGSSDSLPSGHSSATFATASVLGGHFGWRAALPAYAAAGFVGWTRVRDRAHWLSDVVVGAAVGTIVGRTVTNGHRERTWALVPSASGTEVAIHLIRIPR